MNIQNQNKEAVINYVNAMVIKCKFVIDRSCFSGLLTKYFLNLNKNYLEMVYQ